MNQIDRAFTMRGTTTGPPLPLRGADRPQKLMMTIPKKITYRHIKLAGEILDQSVEYLFPNRLYWLDEDGRSRREEELRRSWEEIVEIAVWEQWRIYDPKKFIRLLKRQSELIETSKRGNTLYSHKVIYRDVHLLRERTFDNYYLAYTCPSTKKLYVSKVQGDRTGPRSADQAMAWKYGLTLSQYDSLDQEG